MEICLCHIMNFFRHKAGFQFFFFRAGQEAQIFAHGHDGAAHHHAAVGVFVHGALQARGQGDQGFARAGGAHQGHDIQAVVQQQFHGKALLFV